MARQDALKAYMDAHWQYRAAIGNVDGSILRDFETRLHELWRALDEGQKRRALEEMIRMVAS